MHATWRATLAYLLLAAACLGSLALALELSFAGSRIPVAVIGWTVFLLIAAFAAVARYERREAFRLRHALAVGLTHHLRTSLAHVQTFNEMLILDRAASDQQREEWLEVVGREAQRIGSTVENLLFLMSDSPSQEFGVRKPIDLGNLLEDVACGCAGPPERRLKVEVNPPAGIVVNADVAALRHAFGNLLDGAVRTAREGSTISATAAAEGDQASVIVLYDPSEGGREVRYDDWNLIDRSRMEGCTSEGFGLELAVVRHLVKQHGGRATRFHDHNGAGFRIVLPLSRT